MAPKYYPISENSQIYLVDGPGINDSDLKKEYANLTGIKYILNKCHTFTILLVIDAN